MSKYSSKPKTPRTRPNYFYSIVSVALVLFLLGFFGLIILHGQQFVKIAKENVEIIIELKQETDGSQIGSLKEELAATEYVKPGSVQFISKADGANLLAEELGDEFMKLDLENPLYDVITFNVRAAFMEPEQLANIKGNLKRKSFISDVFFQENLVDAIAQNLKKMSWITLGIGIFFIFVAITLIHNTIRLALYSNRFLIKNMELVGASWEFISYPYISKSLRLGFLSAFLAILGLVGFLFWVNQTIPEMKELIHVPGIIIIGSCLVIAGILINAISTWFVVNKYLRMRVDDLY